MNGYKDKWICKHWIELDDEGGGSCEYCRGADRQCGCSASYSQCEFPSRFEREMEKCDFCNISYGTEEIRWVRTETHFKKTCQKCREKAWLDKIHAILKRRKEAGLCV
jgi:hypothetical protein